jgi:hypothetical protein
MKQIERLLIGGVVILILYNLVPQIVAVFK